MLTAKHSTLMRELVSDAIILGYRPQGEYDRVVDLYTRTLGRIEARMVSGRKPLSKLAPQCDFLNYVVARFVIKHQPIITDVLVVERFHLVRADTHLYSRFLRLAALLMNTIPLFQADERLWHMLIGMFRTREIFEAQILAYAGFHPQFATCISCSVSPVTHFVMSDHSFVCNSCSVRFPLPLLFAMM